MNNRWQTRLIESYHGETPSGVGAAAWSLDTTWAWAPWATVLLVLAAVGMIGWLYAREAPGAGGWYRGLLAALRLTAIGIVLVMLAQWAISLRLTGEPPIALVIDRSASMGIADHYRGEELAASVRGQLIAAGLVEPSRLDLAKLLVTGDDRRLLQELARRYRLETYLVAADIQRLPSSQQVADVARAIGELSPDGPRSEATRLGDAVRRVLDDLRGTPPAAIVLLTDGVVTEGIALTDAARDARRQGVPIVAVGLGSPTPPRDIELADVLVDDAVFAGDPVSFLAQVKAHGLEGESATINLRREGDPTPRAEQDITLPPAGQTLPVQLVDRVAEPGEVAYVVEIVPREDEIDPHNNRQRRVVSVHDEKIRVLLAYGYPSYEFRFQRTLLQREPTIELATFLQDADPEHADQDKSAVRRFPLGRDELFEYDVVLVGDVNPRLLPSSTWSDLRAFVAEKGGGVAFSAGPRYLPSQYYDNADVTALLPIDRSAIALAADRQLPGSASSGFTVHPTPLGLQNPAMQLGQTPADTERIWRELAPLYWRFEVSDVKPAAQVLAEGSPKPLIVLQYVGPGRVLFHSVDSTWRWRQGDGEAYFARYWVQAIRFLARGKLTGGLGAQLTSDRREYRLGEAVELRARFLDPRVAPPSGEAEVLVDAPGQTRRRVALRRNPAFEGVFEATVAGLAEGQYEAVLAESRLPDRPPVARFSVVAPPGEFARLEIDVPALTAAAEITRGRFYTIGDAHRLLDELPTGRRVPVENLPPLTIWNRWWMLAALLTCLTAEWILRKRKGML